MIINKDLFVVGPEENGKFNYQVNGAFMYLTEEEMNQFRLAVVEAIGEAEGFWSSTHKDSFGRIIKK